MSNGKVIIILLKFWLIKKQIVLKNESFSWTIFNRQEDKIKLELNLSNYATKYYF